MSAAAIARKLADAGLDAAAIVAALEAFEAVEEERKAKKREGNRERQRRHRGKVDVTPVTRDNALQGVTERDTPFPSEVSPQTPLPTNPNPIPPSPPKGGSSPKISDFDQFWSAFPAKVGKKAAQRAWGRAKDRPPLADLLAALDRYRRAKPADRDWCNPATWLNQGRWADEFGEGTGPPPVVIDLAEVETRRRLLEQRLSASA